jgi:beta-lactamase class A
LIENRILPARAELIANLNIEPKVFVAKAEKAVEGIQTAVPVVVTSASLEQVIAQSLEGAKGKYSIAIKNLKTGETYFKGENEQFESASLYKLWVMGTTYEKVKEGTIQEDDALSASVTSLNSEFGIASDSAEQIEGGISLSVKSALSQMITISHNYSALLLTSKVKLASIKKYLQDKGLSASKTGSPPKTTAADTLTFFEKLYSGSLADQTYSTKMLNLLKKQQLNKKLPKYLPSGTVMAHKTGELGQVSHDGGIVYTEKGDYIIVVLSESTLPKGAEERIANISKDVYAYFMSK